MSQPRVAILGKSRSILTWFDDTLDGFRQQGCEVAAVSFQADTPAERISQKRGEGKELHNPEVVRRSAAELAAFSPDLVLVLNKAGVPEPAAEAWKKAVRPGVPVVGWLCDCINRVPQQQIPAFDGVYYFDSHCIPVLEQFYAAHDRPAWLKYLPLAVNPARYPFRKPAKTVPKLVFAGKCSPHRHKIFAEMRSVGIALDLYGPGSRNWLRPWRNRRLSSETIAELYRAHVAVLNLPQPGNTERGLNLRAFEIPAAGGIGTYPDVPDLPLCFLPGKEIIVYKNAADLAARLADLRADPALAAAIIEAGHARVLRDHTFAKRAETVLADWLR
ncbi:glycosyltransferase [Luteolibacter ambystomatis]|uniref:Glycosyltransferase n=1 Tax=Luteolibacter ambystomatis TaxID=2824561 RepID=A0A975G6V2_9BACT|nr:glycosyltransferase [Luteolibacter ambystomatis]QUE50043.1 glycosyltransferase [Luteolibacter ambystomatis]